VADFGMVRTTPFTDDGGAAGDSEATAAVDHYVSGATRLLARRAQARTVRVPLNLLIIGSHRWLARSLV
jgi:hypothetical protein